MATPADDSDLGPVATVGPSPAQVGDDSDLGPTMADSGAIQPSMGLKGYAKKGLEIGGKVLDYPRGAIGAPILSAIASRISGKQTMSPEEYADAVNPTTTRLAPSSDTILERAGVPKGPSLSDVAPSLFAPAGTGAFYSAFDPRHYAAEKGGLFDVTPRGVAGGVLDMATNPLSFESGALNEGAKKASNAVKEIPVVGPALSSVVKTPAQAVEGMGTAAYESGMHPLISKGEEYGKDVANDLYNAKMWGRPGSVAKAGDDAAEVFKNEIGQNRAATQPLIDSALDATMGPSKERGMQNYIDFLDEKVASGDMAQEEADSLIDKELKTTAAVSQPTLNQMAGWKTRSYNKAKKSAFLENANPDIAKQAELAKGAGYRGEIENSMNEASPGAGDIEADKNRRLGNLLTVQGVADKQAAREGNSRWISPNAGEHAKTSALINKDPLSALISLGGSVALKAFNDRTLRNSLGYLAKKTATSPTGGALINAAGIDTLRNMTNQNQPVPGTGR